MNEKLLKALREVLGLSEDADTDAIVASMKKDGKDVWQPIFDEGHGTAYAQQQAKIDRLTNEKVALVTARDKVQSDLQEARGKAPDVEAVRAQLQARVDELEAQVGGLEGQMATERKQWRIDTVKARLRAELAPQVVDGYEELLVDRDASKLLSFDEQDNFTILRPGKSIPYSGDEEAQVKALAADLLKNVKPVFKATAVKNGSGREGEGGTGPSGNLFEDIRKQAKDEKGPPPKDVESELNRRLGLNSISG
jgi:chaperonin cofactor prefoldin